MCVGCHLAPGKDTSEIHQGLSPQPPKLAKRAKQRTLEEIFWVTRHGIKMTGMPAWGVTHDDTQLWAIAAFVKQLPELSAEQYQAMKQQAVDDGHHQDDHSH
ncbi:MAG: cytochrome c, partial [Pseudohongiellaceae bacterium]